MNFRKNICIAAAAAMAVSVCAVSVSAAELKGSCSFSDSKWWTEYVLFGVPDGKCAAPEFLKGIDPNQPWEITVKGDTKFFLGYNGSDGKWHQDEGEEITLKSSDLQIDGKSDLLKICLSKGDSVTYNFEWVVTGADAPAAEEAPADEAPAEEAAAEEETVALPVEEEAAEEEAADEAPAEEAAEVPTEDSFWDALNNDGYVKISDGGTSSNWGQAVQKLTYNNIGEGDVIGADIFYVSLLNEDTAVVVTYESDQVPEMILQSWSGGEGWAKIPPNEEYSTDGVAVFTYDYMTAMYQSEDFSTVDSFYIGDTGVDLTVSEIAIVDVSKFTGAAADEEEEAPAAEEEAAPVEEAAPAPAPVESSNVPATGNMSAAALAGILAAAGAAAVALRKKN